MKLRRVLLALALAAAALSPARADNIADLKKMMLRPLAEEAPDPTPPVEVVTRGWGNEKFGRLVFDWNQPVGFSAKVVGNQLRVKFDHPLKTSFKNVSKLLARYFTDIRIQSNNKTVTANLRGYFDVRSFSNENAVVVDLIPSKGPTGDPEEDPDAWLKRLPIVPVRAGEHPGFGRLVFDWSGDVGYELEKEGKFVRIRFDRPARMDLSRLAAALPGRVLATTSETKKSQVFVALMVPADARIRHFRDGSKVAVDIIAPAPPPRPKPQVAGIPETEAQKKARTTTRAMDDGKHGEDRAGASGPTPLSLSRKAERARREAEREARRSAKKFKDAPLVTVDADRRGPALDITFNWRKPVSAAVYRRGDYVWILFDDRARLGIGTLRVIGKGLIDDVEQTDASDMTLMRMQVPDHFIPTVRKAGTIWTVRLAPPRISPPVDKPVAVTTESQPDGRTTLLLSAPGLDRPHVFADRIIGDVIRVYTVRTPGVGNRVDRRLVNVEVLASGLGLAVVPRGDGMRFLRDAEGLHVSAPYGLSVSRGLDKPGSQRPHESLFLLSDLSRWAGGSPDDYEKNKQLLQQRILVAPEKQKNKARLGLAHFYLANGMAADAMGVIKTMLTEQPDLEKRVDLRALRAAAHYLLGHYALAAQGFDDPDMKGDPSLAPWRAGIAAARGDWQKAYQLIRDSAGMVAGMPAWMRSRFRLIGAEAALAVKDIDGAKPWLDGLKTSNLSKEDYDYLQFLLGHAAKLEGKLGVAESIWRGLMRTGPRYVRAKAKFALINTEYDSHDITRTQAIDALEGLSFAWRGDAFEFDLKRRLGDLYAANGNYRTSLLRLRQAASHFKDVDGAEAIAKDMRKRFRKLFLEGGADKMEPVRALALYDEFQELTPPGEEGDEMIRKLADRLVKVDLLADAARLLDKQVRFRLTGLQRSRVGARLALIDLLDRKPAKALEALKISDGSELPADLEVHRRYLKVRALGEDGKTDPALALISGDVSQKAELLRLWIYWKTSNWAEIAHTIHRIIPEQHVAALTPQDADLVLRWAVSLTMMNDTEGLIALKERFGEAIAKTKYAAAFKAVTDVEQKIAPDFKTLVRQVADLGDFQSFMSSYRDKIHNNALSAIY